MANPVELMSGPLTLYWAPVGETMTDVDSTPAGNWTKIGTSGDKNYEEDGVVLELSQSMEMWRSLGSPWPIGAFRTEQDLVIRVTMADMDLDQLRVGMDLLSPGSDAGPPAIQTLDFDYGLSVSEMALLIRGTGSSPAFEGGNIQFEVNRVVEMAAHALEFTKGGPAGMELEFHALEDSNGNVGQIVAQTA